MNQEIRNCIFGGQCYSNNCDMSCAKNTMSQLLLEKSEIPWRSDCYKTPDIVTDKYTELLASNEGKLVTMEVKDPQIVADSVTYTGICNYCEGHGSNITVYQMKYSKYVQSLRDSWSSGVTPKFREIQAFCSNAKILVISSLDFVTYTDFECQTLLNLFQERARPGYTTVAVLNKISSLVSRGNSPFYEVLKNQLERGLRR